MAIGGGITARQAGACIVLALCTAAGPKGAAAVEPRPAPTAGPSTSAAVPLFDWRVASPWLWAAPGRPFGGAERPDLMLDLHPLHNGFRLSIAPGFDRGPAPDPAAPPPDGLGSATEAPWYLGPWYFGLGWTESLGGRLSLFVDVGASYTLSGAGFGTAFGADRPQIVLDLGNDANWTGTEKADGRLSTMLSVTFALRF